MLQNLDFFVTEGAPIDLRPRLADSPLSTEVSNCLLTDTTSAFKFHRDLT